MAKKKYDRYVDGQMLMVICNKCKHYNRDATCKAFPAGIPYSILSGGKHTQRLKEQANEIVFEER